MGNSKHTLIKAASVQMLNLLRIIGEDTDREGLKETPKRYVKFLWDFTHPKPFKFTTFANDGSQELLTQGPIPFFSLCVPSKQPVNTATGSRPASSVKEGDLLWTVVDGKVTKTRVDAVSSHLTCRLVEVETDQGTFKVTPDHPVATPLKWKEASSLKPGDFVEWTLPSSLCRSRFSVKLNYDFGYALGAIFSDGTTAKRYVSLVVNERSFAERFSLALKNGFGIDSKVEPCSRPSGFLKREVPGFRVRVVSSYLAQLIRQYAGGDANHLRQRFPRVVLTSKEVMQGFLDGYIEGDGSYNKKGKGSATIVSANTNFLKEMAEAIESSQKIKDYAFGLSTPTLYVPARWHQAGWFGRHGFIEEREHSELIESSFVRVKNVRRINSTGPKPFRVYSFQCSPHSSFLVGGFLTHNCEHHLAPFFGEAFVGYIPKDRIVGLSKLTRQLQFCASGLNNQERITHNAAHSLAQKLNTPDVAVTIRARHLCMEMRGVRTHDVFTTTTCVLGVIKSDPACRAEFLMRTQK